VADDPQATVVGGPPADGTQVLPPAADEPPRWSARAQVRPAGGDDDGPIGYAEPAAWVEPDERPRGFFSPAVIAVLIVVLLALIGLGVWLALRGRGAEPVPGPTTSPTASATPTRTTPPATTPPPEPTTPPPATIGIPPLQGLTYDDAATALTALGFVPERVDEASDSVPAGRVIRTNPPAGTQILPGEPVQVIVSTGPATTAPPPTTPPAPEPT
jgi:hypothetical protein